MEHAEADAVEDEAHDLAVRVVGKADRVRHGRVHHRLVRLDRLGPHSAVVDLAHAQVLRVGNSTIEASNRVLRAAPAAIFVRVLARKPPQAAVVELEGGIAALPCNLLADLAPHLSAKRHALPAAVLGGPGHAHPGALPIGSEQPHVAPVELHDGTCVEERLARAVREGLRWAALLEYHDVAAAIRVHAAHLGQREQEAARLFLGALGQCHAASKVRGRVPRRHLRQRAVVDEHACTQVKVGLRSGSGSESGSGSDSR